MPSKCYRLSRMASWRVAVGCLGLLACSEGGEIEPLRAVIRDAGVEAATVSDSGSSEAATESGADAEAGLDAGVDSDAGMTVDAPEEFMTTDSEPETGTTLGWEGGCAPCYATTVECTSLFGFVCPLASCTSPPPTLTKGPSGCTDDAHVDSGLIYFCCPFGNPGE